MKASRLQGMRAAGKHALRSSRPFLVNFVDLLNAISMLSTSTEKCRHKWNGPFHKIVQFEAKSAFPK